MEDFKDLSNFLLQLQELGKKQKMKENQSGNDERTGTRAGTRSSTRLQTRATTREMHSRDALCLPDICQTTTGRTYFQLFPPKPKPLHQWRDLKNRIRHDYNLVPLPYKEVDVVKRWLFCAFLLRRNNTFYLFLNKKVWYFHKMVFHITMSNTANSMYRKRNIWILLFKELLSKLKIQLQFTKKNIPFSISTVCSFTAIWQHNSKNEAA